MRKLVTKIEFLLFFDKMKPLSQITTSEPLSWLPISESLSRLPTELQYYILGMLPQRDLLKYSNIFPNSIAGNVYDILIKKEFNKCLVKINEIDYRIEYNKVNYNGKKYSISYVVKNGRKRLIYRLYQNLQENNSYCSSEVYNGGLEIVFCRYKFVRRNREFGSKKGSEIYYRTVMNIIQIHIEHIYIYERSFGKYEIKYDY